MGKTEYTLESARDRLEAHGIQIDGTAIWLDERNPIGIQLWGTVDYLTGEMGFQVNPLDRKKLKKSRKKKEDDDAS